MLSPIKFETKIKFEDIDIKWIPRFEFYYPDLAQFPTVYVHIKKDGNRIYGFPVTISVQPSGDKRCDVEVIFLSNLDLNADAGLKNAIKSELEERFGISNKVDINDVIKACNGDKKYIAFFKELWKYVSETFGDSIPYGRFYEEIYSMVRFVSAWQPKTGRQSEMRMLYNFLSIFGEPIPVEGRFSFLSFFLLPTYDDVMENHLNDFAKFKELMTAIEKIWNIYFTESYELDGIEIKSMKHSWPQKKDTFIKEVTYPLFKKGKITGKERLNIERLVDAFNRHSWRTAFYIWSIMTAKNSDFRKWDREIFEKFCVNNNGVGISEKVVACFLQQGFGKDQVIPIDTWIKAFYEEVLGIPHREELFSKFSDLGKLERVIWAVSQARKTNIMTFFNIMWCVRFGNTGNSELRGHNPIACYECELKSSCPGYSLIKESKTLIIESGGKSINMNKAFKQAALKDCRFICSTEDFVPKKIYSKRGKNWKLIDEFSGYILTTQKVPKKYINKIVSVNNILQSMPEFKGSSLLLQPEP